MLHFIFVIKDQDQGKRDFEFGYVERMAQFYRRWIREKAGVDLDVKCDTMITRPRNILQRLDTHTLVRDHQDRDPDTWHFYLTHFRPLWTDCTCEGYHAENFGMAFWQQSDDELVLAEKNCTTVSHELLHELLRVAGNKKYVQLVHDTWTKHFYGQLEFEQYGKDFGRTDGKPSFLTMDTTQLGLDP